MELTARKPRRLGKLTTAKIDGKKKDCLEDGLGINERIIFCPLLHLCTNELLKYVYRFVPPANVENAFNYLVTYFNNDDEDGNAEDDDSSDDNDDEDDREYKLPKKTSPLF